MTTHHQHHPAPASSQQTQQQQEAAAAAATAELESNKRAALAGQWRTPPMPTFPTTTTTAAATPSPAPVEGLPPIPSVSVSQLPGSAEDYAKALQEAYLRGAEAAAAMAAGNQAAKPVAAATETTHQQSVVVVAAPPPGPTHTMPAPPANTMPAPMVYSGTVVAPKAPPPPTTTATTAAPPPPPQPTTTLVPNPLPPVPPVSATTTTTTTTTNHNGSNPARTMSLPDMTTYAAQQEEEKRQKRLARNRASARLRRLRKKNLVDAYEQEVGILEKTLEQLKAHEWGKSDNAGALAEALSMDRGQQVLDMQERQKEAAALLQQQLEWVHMLEDILMEDYVLHQIVDNNNDNNSSSSSNNPELQELAASLQLSPEQMRQVQESKAGWQDEWDALQTVKASLVAMQQKEWLWNESVGSVAEQFMSILHKNQISKFLLWADANAEAIDELDGVHASQGVPSGPIFSFGVDSHPQGLNEEEK